MPKSSDNIDSGDELSAADAAAAQKLIDEGRAGLPSAQDVDAVGKEATKAQLKEAQDLIDQGRRELNDGLAETPAETSDDTSTKAGSGGASSDS